MSVYSYSRRVVAHCFDVIKLRYSNSSSRGTNEMWKYQVFGNLCYSWISWIFKLLFLLFFWQSDLPGKWWLLSCFYSYVDLFLMSSFLIVTCRDDMLAVTLLDNLSLSLLHPFASPSYKSMKTLYMFWVTIVSLCCVLSLFLTEYLLEVSNWFSIFYIVIFQLFIRRKILVIRRNIF